MRTRKVYSTPPVFYIDDREVSEAEYEAAGHPNRLRDMLLTGQTPCCITDAALWQGNWNQFAGSRNEQEAGDYYASVARQHGVDPKGKLYLSGLAAFPGDPRAWVETRGDIKRICEERNWECRGLVTHKRNNDHPVEDSIELADDIVEEAMAEVMAEQPGLVTNEKEKADLREKVYNTHKPPPSKKRKSK